MYTVVVGEEVEEDLASLRAFDARRVLDTMQEALVWEPTVPARNRKRLENLSPPFYAVDPVWELRVGDYRVFCDVNEEDRVVYVRAVRRKPPHRTTGEIL